LLSARLISYFHLFSAFLLSYTDSLALRTVYIWKETMSCPRSVHEESNRKAKNPIPLERAEFLISLLSLPIAKAIGSGSNDSSTHADRRAKVISSFVFRHVHHLISIPLPLPPTKILNPPASTKDRLLHLPFSFDLRSIAFRIASF